MAAKKRTSPLTEQHRAAMSALKARQKAELASLRALHAGEVERLKGKHKAEKQARTTSYRGFKPRGKTTRKAPPKPSRGRKVERYSGWGKK